MSIEAKQVIAGPYAGGQTIRLPGSDRVAEIHGQLYRYAEDLQQLMERNDELESRHQALLGSIGKLQGSHHELNALMQASRDIHLLTDRKGVILQANPTTKRLANEGELLNSNLLAWIHPDSLAGFDQLLSEAANLASQTKLEATLTLKEAGQVSLPINVSTQVLIVPNSPEVTHLHWIMHEPPVLERQNVFVGGIVLAAALLR